MGQLEKIITLILGGRSDQNIGFADICTLLQRLGFSERIRGSHHIFFRVDIPEIINLQP